jgi:MGT family glycosyltransferase
MSCENEQRSCNLAFTLNLIQKNMNTQIMQAFQGPPPVADLQGKKILFANFPADGHFNPLTGLAIHLRSMGCEIGWYTSEKYASRIEKMNIKHYPLKQAVDSAILEDVFPERDAIKGQIAKLSFDIIHAFILRGPEYFKDILDIYEEFPFDVMIADCAFTGIPFVTDKMNIPVVSIGVLPLTETSVDLPPAGIGMMPSYTFVGKIKQAVLRYAANKIIFRKPNRVMKSLLTKYGIDHLNTNVFDLLVKKASLLLQSGTPGFEYRRSDLGKNIRFVGSLLPVHPVKATGQWFDERLGRYQRIVLVTQGTVEKNIEKILVPALEAFKDSNTLIIATTGGTGTRELRKRFPYNNLIIEDFIPFADIMPYADVYISNGGYGGVMLGIENRLPMIVAGIHEGKSEINARVGYFKLGINLRTEWPTPRQLKQAVELIMNDDLYKDNVTRLAKEFSEYKPNELCAEYLAGLVVREGIRN